jgi:hypothetical protein
MNPLSGIDMGLRVACELTRGDKWHWGTTVKEIVCKC